MLRRVGIIGYAIRNSENTPKLVPFGRVRKERKRAMPCCLIILDL
jgi:hypothetical protein